MCRELHALSNAISSYAAGFDGAALPAAEAAVIVSVCSRMEASIASVKVLAAARVSEEDSWKLEGYRSAADQLAGRAGMSPGSARRALETGRRPATQPDVARAALAGDLTAEQAAAVSAGAAADPSRTGDLIERARWATVPELNQEVARTRAAATDLEARRRAIHARRSLKRWDDGEGAVRAHLYGNPEGAMAVWQAIDPIRRRLIMTRRGTQPAEKLDALDYDALVLLARVATGQGAELSFEELIDIGLFPQAQAASTAQRALFGEADHKKLAGSPAKVIVRVDLDTLLRGWPISGEMCEMDGCGPVPVSLVQELMSRDATVLAVALTRHRQVQGVYHHARRPNAHQSTALELLYPTCAAAGCQARTGLQSDHRADWADTHFTALDYLDRLCAHHHKLKTHHGWALVSGTGKRAFVPPGHPDHPAAARTVPTRVAPAPAAQPAAAPVPTAPPQETAQPVLPPEPAAGSPPKPPPPAPP